MTEVTIVRTICRCSYCFESRMRYLEFIRKERQSIADVLKYFDIDLLDRLAAVINLPISLFWSSYTVAWAIAKAAFPIEGENE